MFNTLLFPILFLIFGILLLWIILGCKGHWSLKYWVINLTVLFVLFFWESVNSYTGWATDQKMPSQARFLSFYPDEPKYLFVILQKDWSKEKRSNIFDLVGSRSGDEPRMYKLPYNRETHEKMEKAMDKVRKGQYVVISSSEMDEDGKEIKSKSNNSMTRDDAPNFYVLPPEKIIKKPD